MRRTTATLLAALIPLVVAGCGGSTTDKAGGARATKPTVLTLANGNGDGHMLEPFAAAVARLSGGTLSVEIKSHWRHGTPDFETGLIRDVQVGTADVGWAGTRAFDDVGVPSFDALHAPLLIDSYPLERKALESPVVAEMLGGLGKAGVTGLGVLPGPLRKPLGISRLVRPQDYAGTTLAVQRSQVAEQALHVLGARGAAIPASGAIDSYDGVEQQIESIAGNQYDKVGSYLTANVNLWPRPVVVFANTKALDGLDGRQRAALLGAARASQAATLALLQADDREATAVLCRRGVRFVTARAADLAALRRAVQPVYDRLERRGRTKAAIERIRALRSDLRTSPDAPACSRPASQPVSARTPLDGVYRLSSTRAQAVKASGDPNVESENYGRYRFVMSRGRLRYTQSSEGASRWTTATYTVKGRIFTFTVTDFGGEAPHGAAEKTGEVFTFRWSRYRDRLTLAPVRGKISPENFRIRPWRRVGDAP